MAAGDQIWRQVKQGPHREHFPALWRALPFVLPPIPSQRSRSFPGLTMRSQVLQSAIFSCIMQTAYRFVGVELRFRHPASRKHGGRHVYRGRNHLTAAGLERWHTDRPEPPGFRVHTFASRIWPCSQLINRMFTRSNTLGNWRGGLDCRAILL